jgi:hypothetical protein
VGRRAAELDLHLRELIAVHAGRRVRDGRGLAGALVDDGERLEEVVDLVAGDGDVERVALDVGLALEVGDAVPVHDHAAQRGVGLHERARRPAAERADDAQESQRYRDPAHELLLNAAAYPGLGAR